MFGFLQTFFVKSEASRLELPVVISSELREYFSLVSGELDPAYSYGYYGHNVPYIHFDGANYSKTLLTVGSHRIVPNRQFSGLLVKVDKDIEIKFTPQYHSVPEDVRKRIRAMELKMDFKIPNNTRVLSLTHGEGILESSLSKYVKMIGIAVYNFPGYELKKTQRHYPVHYVSFEKYDLNNYAKSCNIINSVGEFDCFYFDTSASYSNINVDVLIKIFKTYKKNIVLRLSVFNTLSKLCTLFAYAATVHVIQPISSMPGDYYCYITGFRDVYSLDFAHASLAYSVCKIRDNYSPSICMVHAEKARGGRWIDYQPPNTSCRTLSEFYRMTDIWTQGLRKEAAHLVVENSEFFKGILIELLEGHSWTNNPFKDLERHLFKESVPFKHIKYAITNDFAYVQVSQSGRHIDSQFKRVVDFLGAGIEHTVPDIDNHTMEGSICIRIDQDLNDTFDSEYYVSFLPVFEKAVLKIVEDFSHLFKNEDYDFMNLGTRECKTQKDFERLEKRSDFFISLLDQCNKTSSVGLTARHLAPGASSIGEALQVREFIRETESVFIRANMSSPSEENLLFTMFGKNHEIMLPTKLYEGRQVPRLLIFKGAQYRIALSGMFYPALRRAVSGKFPMQVGKTPMQVSKELLEKYESFKDPAVAEIDLSNWDKGVQVLHQLGMYYIMSRFIPNFKQSYMNYFYHEIFKFLVIDGKLLYGYAFRSTGGEDTLLGNSFMHMIIVYAMLIFSGVFNYIWFSIVGDDGIFIGEKHHVKRIDFSIYNAHGMKLKNFPCSCLEDLRYLGHGYTRTRFGAPAMLRPIWALVSRAPFIWSVHENRSQLSMKVISYLILYFWVLEYRIVSFFVIQEHSLDFFEADMSERGMGYVSVSVDSIMGVVGSFWNNGNPNDFISRDNAIYNIHEDSHNGVQIEPMKFYQIFLNLDEKYHQYFPPKQEILSYFEYCSAFMRSRRGAQL